MVEKIIEHPYSGSLYDQVVPIERAALNQYAVQPSKMLGAVSEQVAVSVRHDADNWT